MIGYIIVVGVTLNVLCTKGHPELKRYFTHERISSVTENSQYFSSDVPHPLQRHSFHEDRDSGTYVTENNYRKSNHHNTRNANINARSSESYQNLHTTGRKSLTERDIVFPGGTGSSVNFLPRSRPKKCIKGICEDTDDYPADYIKNALSRKPELQKFFSSEETAPNIGNRIGDDQSERSLCETKGHTKYPKLARNTNQTDKFIVNVEGFKQGIVFETCVERATCQFSELFPNDYETGCKQRYVIRRLMAINEDGNPAFDSFEIPSCCVCTYKKKKN